MDGLKLDRWKENFLREVKNVQIEFASFFKEKDLDAYYSLQMDGSDEFSLELNDELPNEIKERLMQLLLATKPEDSI